MRQLERSEGSATRLILPPAQREETASAGQMTREIELCNGGPEPVNITFRGMATHVTEMRNSLRNNMLGNAWNAHCNRPFTDLLDELNRQNPNQNEIRRLAMRAYISIGEVPAADMNPGFPLRALHDMRSNLEFYIRNVSQLQNTNN